MCGQQRAPQSGSQDPQRDCYRDPREPKTVGLPVGKINPCPQIPQKGKLMFQGPEMPNPQFNGVNREPNEKPWESTLKPKARAKPSRVSGKGFKSGVPAFGCGAPEFRTQSSSKGTQNPLCLSVKDVQPGGNQEKSTVDPME